MSPLIVRPLEGTTDQYEIISGHRRFRAAQKAGLSEVPAFIRPVSRDEAAIMLVDSNLHREHILPYEIIDREDCTPSYSQAFRLHKSFNNCALTREGLAAVMSEEKPNQKEKVSFKYDDLRKYFPDSYSVGDIQRYILNLVAKDYRRQHNRSRGGDAR